MAGSEFDETKSEIVKTLQETDRKCPRCGGVMDFDPGTGGLLCPYCDYTESIDEGDEVMEQSFEEAEHLGNCDWGVATKVVICKSCGAENVYDVMQTSGECPYCGSNQVMEAADRNTLAPTGVCPFEITEKQANENFLRWIRKKLFCPSKAKKTAKAKGFKGIYLPYWTFDSDTTSHYTARYGIDRTETDSDGNSHTVTDWYNTSGVYYKFIDDELVVASDRHDQKQLKSIEPFNTAKSVEYKPEYISGFVSERYSKGLSDAWKTAETQIERKIREGIRNQIISQTMADRVEAIHFSTIYANRTYKYIILPVWFSHFKYNDKVYNFSVNGQTGKVGGKAPVSPLKVALAILIIIAVLILLFVLFRNF